MFGAYASFPLFSELIHTLFEGGIERWWETRIDVKVSYFVFRKELNPK